MKMGIIYKASNPVTGEVYIGATEKSLDERRRDHLQKANKKVGGYFQEAIGTYGPEVFLWEQIDTASSSDELASKEIKYISEYNSVEDGYNSDKGGGFKKTVYQYNLDGLLVNSFEDLTSAANAINSTKKAISRACWNVSHTLGGFLWSYEYVELFRPQQDCRKKVVKQYGLDGNLLAQYISIAEASRKTGLSKTCIARCCRGERENSGGFIWRYL
ncbi:GIY-YIG nuclease family protein [Flavobacterium sp. CYK-4]|uniref:NUMOD1 domain-containing DNA-binding protein n=1 Tax=Flavobacterium lotistagni TaxID=2709660 RepID=UPI00140A4BB6|nr:NUMOD1 domain-containing DNA-binding protein [Flavobacterium lotistagni]NHM06544.1 GIY-YIG nuclease family protein [Flavobacterium lotistagni]